MAPPGRVIFAWLLFQTVLDARVIMDPPIKALLDAFNQTLAPNPVRRAAPRRPSLAIRCCAKDPDEFVVRAGSDQAGRGVPQGRLVAAGLRDPRPAGALPGRPPRGNRARRQRIGATPWPPRAAQLISLDSVPIEVRQAAAVNFKNYVKYHWVSAGSRPGPSARRWRPAAPRSHQCRQS